MDHSDVSRIGGTNSRKNMSPDKSKKMAQEAAEASWLGHKKGDKKCTCPRCSTKKDAKSN